VKVTPPTVIFFKYYQLEKRGRLILGSLGIIGTFGKNFPLVRHEPHIKRRVQQYFYCCVCIRCRGNVFTEPLPSSDKGIHMHTD
jgi:hypothetical protein